MRFDGKVAIVSGGTKASGATIAFRLAELGAAVVVAGRSTADGEAVAERIQGGGGTASFSRTDVMVEADAHRTVERGALQGWQGSTSAAPSSSRPGPAGRVPCCLFSRAAGAVTGGRSRPAGFPFNEQKGTSMGQSRRGFLAGAAAATVGAATLGVPELAGASGTDGPELSDRIERLFAKLRRRWHPRPTISSRGTRGLFRASTSKAARRCRTTAPSCRSATSSGSYRSRSA